MSTLPTLALEIDDPSWVALTIVHLAATWFLVGLIWTIHFVHYPSFASIDEGKYQEFQQRHMGAMGVLVGPPWLTEGLCVLAVFALAPTPGLRIAATIGGLLEVAVIAVTIVSAIPAHDRLTNGFNVDAHRSLMRGDRLRTVAWTGRAVVASAIALWPLL